MISVSVSLPEKACPKEFSDHRPVALTSIVMKTLERLMFQQLTKSVGGNLDTYQIAYKRNRTTHNGAVSLIHLILKHLDKPKSTARALFLDFTELFLGKYLANSVAEFISDK